MNKRTKLLAAIIVISSIFIATQARAALNHSSGNPVLSSIGAVNAPVGPEADPYLRHRPDGYDFENELPPNELSPLQY